MSIEIIDCDQGGERWLAARLGLPTASCFDEIMTKGKGGAPSKTRATYMRKLVGEIITDRQAEAFYSKDMERGNIMEQEARDLYAMLNDVDPEKVGFVRNTHEWGIVGCSPDSLIGDRGLLEIKTKAPHLQIALLLDGQFPDEHKAQVQGQLWVCEREWCDFISYWTGIKPFIIRVQRDEEYIKALATEVELFTSQMYDMVSKVRAAA